jgi:hypothetical protein
MDADAGHLGTSRTATPRPDLTCRNAVTPGLHNPLESATSDGSRDPQRRGGAQTAAGWVLHLQRTIGNAAVGRLLRSRPQLRPPAATRLVARHEGVSLASPGLDDNPDQVLRFFETAYDPDEHLRRSLAALEEFGGVTDAHRRRLEGDFPNRFGRHLESLGTEPSSRAAVRVSLETMSTLSKRRAMPLAASFVLGLRESGANLTRNRPILDSFWGSGLDHLYDTQHGLRTSGFLPPDLSLRRGARFGEANEEAGGPIRSARIEARDVFLVHSASVAGAARRFVLLANQHGFSSTEVSALTPMQTNCWIALTFAGPRALPWKSPQLRRQDRGFGATTVLSYLHDHKMRLADISAVLSIALFRSRARTQIAVRTAALITGLDSMMREYAGRHARGAGVGFGTTVGIP